MDLNKLYHDSDDNECNILQLVKKEPEWAANVIQHYEAQLASAQAEVEGLRNHRGLCHSCVLENEMECGAENEDVEYADCKIVMKCNKFSKP